jgi:hypothetical protein
MTDTSNSLVKDDSCDHWNLSYQLANPNMTKSWTAFEINHSNQIYQIDNNIQWLIQVILNPVIFLWIFQAEQKSSYSLYLISLKSTWTNKSRVWLNWFDFNVYKAISLEPMNGIKNSDFWRIDWLFSHNHQIKKPWIIIFIIDKFQPLKSKVSKYLVIKLKIATV